MEPTILYTNALLAGNKNHEIKSISHITGGGLIENPPRAFNKNLTIKFDMKFGRKFNNFYDNRRNS